VSASMPMSMPVSVPATVRPRPSRPRPHRLDPVVAPPVEEASAPWAALLAEPLASGRFEWVMGPEGALVPVAVADGERPATAKRALLMPRRRRSAKIGA